MAPSTACSASGLQGAARSECSTVEKLSGDTDVIPGRLLPIGVPEESSEVIGHDQRNLAVGMYSPAQISERAADLQQGFRGGRPQGNDHLGFDQLDLPL